MSYYFEFSLRNEPVSLIQNESYQQSPEKTKNNGESEKRDNIKT